MEMKNERDGKKDRRTFLKDGAVAGVLAALGIAAGKVVRGKGNDTVRMMTPDGKLVEVDARFISKSLSKPVTTADLKAWMNDGKK